jgi:hypothetical protein
MERECYPSLQHRLQELIDLDQWFVAEEGLEPPGGVGLVWEDCPTS